MGNSIYARYTDNIFADATFTSTVTPMDSYDVDTLALQRPEMRVRWAAQSLQIDISLPSPAEGAILAIPVTNLEAGSPSGLTITNDNGLSQELAIPAMPINRIPLTLVCDLTVATPSAATRTDDSWHLVFTSVGVNVTLGGAIFLFGPKRELTPADLRWGFSERILHAADDTRNVYLTRYRVDYETQERSLDCAVRCTYAQKELLKTFYLANAGLVQPGLLWPEPATNDAYLGTWQEVFEAQQVDGAGTPFVDDYYDVRLLFTELSKGKPV